MHTSSLAFFHIITHHGRLGLFFFFLAQIARQYIIAEKLGRERKKT
jgi:hypothetical protein